MRFYKRDPDRALAGMSDLTLQERGAYNTLIDLLYARDGEVLDDDEALRRVMGCHGNEWRAVKAKLIARGKIWSEDGFLKARGVDDALSEAAAFSETQRKRAGKRWENARKRAGKVHQKSLKLDTNPEKEMENQGPSDAKGGIPIDRDREITLAKANDAVASDLHSEDLTKIVFGQGLRFLMKEAGISEKSARSMLGKWRSQQGDEALLAALGKAQRAGALDPVEYIQGCFRSATTRKGKADDKRNRLLQMADRLDRRTQADSEVDPDEDHVAALPLLPARGR